MNPEVIFIMGPQGCGKGTQARVLAEKLNMYYWEMGGILRASKEFKLSDGETVGEIIDGGKYLTDEQLTEVIEPRLKSLEVGQGIIFDGIPRRMGQAEYLFNYLAGRGYKNLMTLYIDLPREESIKRLLLRAETEKRTDDTRESIESRLKEHETATLPILDYMKAKTQFIEIDGTPSIDEVTREIFKALGIHE